MSQPNSSSSSTAQDLLDALTAFRQLVEKRRLGIPSVLRDSGRFKAFMRDLYPGMNREIVIISTLIDEGWLIRLHDADVKERVRISGQIQG